MLHVQSYLRNGGILRRLVEEKGLDCKVQDGKVLLNYSMIDSPKLDPIVKECRGLILYEDNWDVASMAFERFFNLGEGGAEDLGPDLYKCMVLEKLDGSMISLWYDRTTKKWQCSTRGMIYADGPVGQLSTKKFSDLFWEGLRNTRRKFFTQVPKIAWHSNEDTDNLNSNYTYVFELTSLENRIVTPYPEPFVTLLTVRDNVSVRELSRVELEHEAKRVRLPVVRICRGYNWEDLLKMQGCAPTYEGYVVLRESSPSHRRVKVKNPAYLAISKLFGKGTTEKALLELIKCGDWPEFLAYYPEYEKNVRHLQAVFQKLCDIIRRDYVDLVPLEDRKAFALEATKRMFPSILFSMRDGRITTLEKDLMLMFPADKLLDMMKRVEEVSLT